MKGPDVGCHESSSLSRPRYDSAEDLKGTRPWRRRSSAARAPYCSSSLDVSRRPPADTAVRRTPGLDVRPAMRAGATAKCVFEPFAPASPLFERLMGILRCSRFRVQTLGTIQEHFFGGFPTLTVDAAQSIGSRFHPVPIFNAMRCKCRANNVIKMVIRLDNYNDARKYYLAIRPVILRMLKTAPSPPKCY